LLTATAAAAVSRAVLGAEDGGYIFGADAVEVEMKAARWFMVEHGG
jgi:hypothetical protein